MLELIVKKLWKNNSIFVGSLQFLSLIYLTICFFQRAITVTRKVNAYVICIGSRFVGGAGKTPICISISKIFPKKKIAFVSRGYKGNLSSYFTAVKVDLNSHDAFDVGDEPILLAKHRPTYICKNRYKAAKMAVANGAEIIIMDDGLQHHTLFKDCSLALEDETAYQNGLVFPAGPLRSPYLSPDVFLIDMAKIHYKVINPPKEKRVFAFCGLARPEKFKNTLHELNLEIIDFKEFPDHHIYEDDDIKYLIKRSKSLNALLLTTEKDYVKIPEEFQKDIEIIKIEAELPKITVKFFKSLLKTSA